MPPLRPTVGFALRFLLVYGALMALWPLVSGSYREFLRTGGDFLFGSSGSVRFQILPQPEGMDDSRIFVRQGDSSQWMWINFSTKHVGYASTAVLAALVLATPFPWSRRVVALGCGYLLLHGFIALRVLILIGAGTTNVPDTVWNRTLGTGLQLLATGQAVSYIAPILIGLLVSLRREELERLFPSWRDRPL